jgi:hypothetical protein
MNIAKKFLFWLFKIFVLPVLKERIEKEVNKLADTLIKSRYNATTIEDIDDIKHHTLDAFTEFSESWLDE